MENVTEREQTAMEIKVVNYIDREDEEVLLEQLQEDEQKAAADALQECAMNTAGYKRNSG